MGGSKLESQKMAGAIPDVIAKMLGDAHCIMPAKIESYDKATRRAVITPMVKKAITDAIKVEIKTIEDVPVCYAGGKTFNIDIEYQAGDTVLVAFADYGIGGWKASDGQKAVNPDDLSSHNLTDAIVLCGIAPEGTDLSEAPHFSADVDGNIEIKSNKANILVDKDGNITASGEAVTVDGGAIAINGDAINLNGDAKTFVTHTELDTALQTFVTALNAHTHLGNMAAPTGPVIPPQVLNIASSATTTIKTGG